MSEKRGIDVSYAQGNIDFSAIDKNKVHFAIVRSSYGWEKNQKDSKFDRNIKGFRSIGVPVGAYHYSYAKSCEDALKEAKYCLECIKDCEFELPVFYDMEESSAARLGKRTCTDMAKTFCDCIKKAGYQAGVYMNKNWFDNYVYKDELVGNYSIWLAQWGSSEPAFKCDYWQYNVGTRGTLSGINGEIDLDIAYVSLPSADIGSDTNKNENSSTSSGTGNSSSETENNSSVSLKVGDSVRVLDPIDYDTGKKFIVYPEKTYKVIEVSGDRVVIGFDGAVTAAVNAKYLEKIDSVSSDSSAAPASKTYSYKVQPGDNLTWIAKKFGTTVSAIVKENKIKNPDLIYTGEVLKITV